MYSYLTMIKYKQFKRRTSWWNVHAGPRWPWAAAETGRMLCANSAIAHNLVPNRLDALLEGIQRREGLAAALVHRTDPSFHFFILTDSSHKPALLGFKTCLDARTISGCENHSASSESHYNTKKWHNTLLAAVLYPSDPINSAISAAKTVLISHIARVFRGTFWSWRAILLTFAAHAVKCTQVTRQP